MQSPEPRVELVEAERISPSLRCQIAALNATAFVDSGIFAGYIWAPAQWYVLVWLGKTLATSLKLVTRTALATGKELFLGGIGDVVTAPGLRRRGLATLALQRANRAICQELGCQYGLLFCAEHLIPFYERVGYRRVPGPTLVHLPSGIVPFPQPTMMLSCQGMPLPQGPIDLQGPPW